jgi:uncharacterized iron-regulated membrane protein
MKMVRNVVFWLHLALGCAAGLVILIMSLTGVLLAFERQINGWVDAPAVLQGQSESAEKTSLDSVVASLKFKGQGTPDQLVLHNDPSAPLEARYGRERTLFLNPWTAEVIGQPSQRTRAFFSAVERFHRSLGLGMQSAFGRGITGAANLAFLFMLFSGMYLWLPKTFNIASLRRRLMFRRGLQGRGRDWNWHNVIGIWSAIPLLFIVLTGVIMSYPWASNLLFKMTGSQPPARGWRGEMRPHHGTDPDLAAGSKISPNRYRSLDDVAAIAKQQLSGWNSITIDFPDPQSHTVDVTIDRSAGGQPEKASQLVIDRQRGTILTVRHFSTNSLGSKLRAWARFTHTGEEFGLLGQIVAAIACLGAVFLVWTGLAMAMRRMLSAIARSRTTASEAQPVAYVRNG